MKKKIIECVPNFSEGRNTATLGAIESAVRTVPGASLLGLEADRDYNRTVVTFVGSPDAVVEAAFRAASTAAGSIDMVSHKGEHPRLGAVDVVPFVPVSGVSMEECVAASKHFGERLSRELNIPVYLYEYAATRPERRNLASIRRGEYEGLAKRLEDPSWRPDFGEAVFNPKSGATVTGARKFLIAYNVNLSTSDQNLAHEVALRIRESGKVLRDADGNPVKDEQGKNVKVPGTLKAVKAMGVYLERHSIAQVSINLVDFELTSMHDVFEEVRKQARQLGADVTGSELVGLAPLEAFRLAGRFYGADAAVTDEVLVETARKHLGLDQLDPFDPKKKIIEFML
jgi:glutamate formiminotransferase/formiminotetrahydrofolate cyclodeaminase